MKLIGLTGGVGMGKSASAQLLRSQQIPVVDTDDLAREVVEPGQQALEQVQTVFGHDIIGSDGRLRRDVLAQRVFSDPAARHALESILHPRIHQLWLAQADLWRKGGQPLGIVVIPLLFETNAHSELDFTICVACSHATQRQRLLGRGWSLAEIEQRIAAQWPVEKKMAAADFVIWTEGSMEVHAAQLQKILDEISQPA